MSVPYMIATPCWGWLVDSHVLQPEYVSPIGNLLILFSLFLVGPVQYLHIRPDYMLTELGLGLLGIGTAATLTATFSLVQKNALLVLGAAEDGREDQEASSLISGLWTSAFALGNFVGPTVGGPLVDLLGFAGTTPVLQAWALLMLVMDAVVIYWLGAKQFVARRTFGRKADLYVRLE
jgi:MFS family permease